jgi:hypothetical protein
MSPGSLCHASKALAPDAMIALYVSLQFAVMGRANVVGGIVVFWAGGDVAGEVVFVEFVAHCATLCLLCVVGQTCERHS